MFGKKGDPERKASHLRHFRRKVQQYKMGYAGVDQQSEAVSYTDESMIIDAWGQVCQQTQDPSSMARRVALWR